MYNFNQSNETVFKITDNFPKLNSITKYFPFKYKQQKVQYIKTEITEIQRDSLITEYLIF